MAAVSNDLPLVSVVIPTHNRARLVLESIASVRTQEGAGSLFRLEIIVVDDASSDNTPQILADCPDIRYIRLPINRGLSAARSEGVKASTGKYIAFNDDDDLWLPYKLSLLVPALENDPLPGAAYAPILVNCENTIAIVPVGNAPSGNLFPMLLMKDCPVGILGILVRREVFASVGYFDETLLTYEDVDWVLRVAARYSFVFRPGPVALYRLSKKGKYVTDIIEGRTESTLRAIVENALKLLPPDCKDYQKLRHEAFARLELKVAEELAWVEEYDRMKFHLEQAMLEYPQLSREPMVRALVERLVSHMAFKSQSPIGVVKKITRQLNANARRNGLSAFFSMRSLTANIWKSTASDLSQVTSHRQRSVVLVALRAVFANPFMIASPSLLKVFARQTVGTRAYIALALLIDRIF